MARKSKLNAGGWWKFSAYEIHESIRGGVKKKHIRPAKGATLTYYDPWRVWEKSGPIRQDRATACDELIATISGLKCSASDRPGFSKMRANQWAYSAEILEPASEAALLKWCNKHGLLGLLPHGIEQITLEPRGRSSPDDMKEVRNNASVGEISSIVFEQVLYSRTSRGWIETVRPSLDGRGKRFVPSGALWRDSAGQELQWRSLQSLLDFFPTIPKPEDSDIWKGFQYPSPLSADFWELYTEPVSDFLGAAGRLHEAIEAMTITGPRPRAGSNNDGALSRGLRYLDGLLEPANITYEFISGKGIQPRYMAGSLLAALATMALNDRSKGKFLRCQKCGVLFPAGAYPQALYCSKQCRWATQRKAQRDRKKKGGNAP